MVIEFLRVYLTVRTMDFVFSLGLGLSVVIFQFRIVCHTVAQETDRGSRCG